MKRLVSSSRFRLFSLVGIVLVVFGVWIWDGGRAVVPEPVLGTKDVMKLQDRIRSLEGLVSELSAALKTKNAAVEKREETMKEDHVKRSQKMSEDDATKQKKMTEEAKKKKDTQKPEEKKNVADVKTQTPFSADSVRITWESGDEMHLFVSRLCEEGFKKVAPPWMKVNCKADDYEGNIMFFNHYRPHKFTLQVPVHQQIHFHMENHLNCNHQATILWTARPPVDMSCPTHVFLSYGFVRFSFPMPNFQNVSVLLRDPATFPAKEVLASKKFFCALAARDCNYDKYLGIHGLPSSYKGRPLIRTQLFDYISKHYKAAHGLSGCRKNFSPVETKGIVTLEEPIAWFRPYKFAIVMENSEGRGHITEKVFNAYNARTVPIYWGPTDLEEYLNVDALVWCKPDPGSPPFNLTFMSCLEEIKRLDSDDELYMKKLSTPLLKGNMIPPWLTFEHLAKQIIQIWDSHKMLKH